jgi:hypothetical protein
LSDLPPPSRPYRGAALLHAVLAAVILVLAAATDGDLGKAAIVAAAYFVVATGWSWFRFRQRESRHAADHTTTGGGTSAGDGDGGR